MKNLKLNKLNEQEMNAIKGGYVWMEITVGEGSGAVTRRCGCGCYYAGTPGGSSTGDNMNANYKQGPNGSASPLQQTDAPAQAQ